MGTRIPLVKSLTRPLYRKKLTFNPDQKEAWPEVIRKIQIQEACHDGGPIATWTCPWCGQETTQAYEGPIRQHLCTNCSKASKLNADYTIKDRIPAPVRKKIGLLSPKQRGKRQYRKGPCFSCYRPSNEPHTTSCKYSKIKLLRANAPRA